MLRNSLFFVLLACVLAPAATVPVHQVSFRAVTAYGQPVQARVVALSDVLRHRDMVNACTGSRCADLPEGPYSYTVLLPQYRRTVEGSAVIYRTNQIVLVDVGAPAADLDEKAFPRVKGRIVGAYNPSKLWVRLQPLYSDTSISAAVDADGEFQLDDVRPGNWMLLVFDDGKLVHFKPYTCPPSNPPSITVDLTPMIEASSRLSIKQPELKWEAIAHQNCEIIDAVEACLDATTDYEFRVGAGNCRRSSLCASASFSHGAQNGALTFAAQFENLFTPDRRRPESDRLP
jgi:hypothetical protein